MEKGDLPKAAYQFYTWNPAVGDECSSLQADEEYRVGVARTSTSISTGTVRATTSTTTSATPPGPTQPGIPSSCNAYAVTKLGDGCETFADRYGITLAQLYKWNPALNTNCENFWL